MGCSLNYLDQFQPCVPVYPGTTCVARSTCMCTNMIDMLSQFEMLKLLLLFYPAVKQCYKLQEICDMNVSVKNVPATTTTSY
jgi:hypothetical protein